MAIGIVPGWSVLTGMAAFSAGLALLCAKPRERDHRLMGGKACE